MSNEAAQPAAPAIPAWRYKTGLGLFIFGNIVFFGSPILVPALGLSAAYIGAGIIAAEVIMFSSVFFLGWSGLKQLKNKMFGFLKPDPHALPVGKGRHYLGITMTFVVPVVLQLLAFWMILVSYARATAADPFPAVWGIPFEQLDWTVGGLFIGGYVVLVVGLFVLGDHWWGRFQELFVWQGDQ